MKTAARDQLGVSMAERAGVDPKVLRAVLTETPVMMPPDVALHGGSRARPSITIPSADQYRDEIIRRWGRRAVVSSRLASWPRELSDRQIRDGTRQSLHTHRR